MTALDPALLPADEAARLDMVARLKLANPHLEEVFQHFVERASAACGTPIALMTVLDANQQWHKARIGESKQSIARADSFCTHVVRSGEPLVVADATRDERFRDNPLVVPKDGIRMYAGFPIGVAGVSPIGALCVVDQSPRDLSPEEIETLRSLADGLCAEIEVRLRLESVRAAARPGSQPIRSVSAWTVLRHRLEPEPRTVYISDNIEARTGYPPEAFYDDPRLGMEVVHPSDRARLTQAVREGLTFESELTLRWVHRSGTELEVEVRGRTMTGKNNEIVGFEAVARPTAPEDVGWDDTRRAVRELTDSPSYLMVLDPELGLSYVDPGGGQILGVSAEGATWTDQIHPRDRPRVETALKQAAASETVSPVIWFRTTDDPPKIIAATARSGVEGAEGLLVSFHEETPRIREHLLVASARRESATLATKRAAAVERLHRTQRRKAELVAMVVHDLKGPLSVVNMGAEEILELSEDDEVCEIATELVHSADQMRRMVLDILDVQRGSQGEVPVRWTTIDVTQLAQDVVRASHAAAALNGRAVTAKLDRQLPPVSGDKGLLERVLTNLISNAVKYSPKDQPVCLHVDADESGVVRLQVIDHGPGVPDALKAAVFERWHSGDAGTPGRENHGLGLLFCRMAVLAMKGRIQIADTAGGGCTVVVSLPSAALAADAAR